VVGSLNYKAMPLRKLTEVFGLTAEKSWYPHLFNTTDKIKHVGPGPNIFH